MQMTRPQKVGRRAWHALAKSQKRILKPKFKKFHKRARMYAVLKGRGHSAALLRTKGYFVRLSSMHKVNFSVSANLLPSRVAAIYRSWKKCQMRRRIAHADTVRRSDLAAAVRAAVHDDAAPPPAPTEIVVAQAEELSPASGAVETPSPAHEAAETTQDEEPQPVPGGADNWEKVATATSLMAYQGDGANGTDVSCKVCGFECSPSKFASGHILQHTRPTIQCSSKVNCTRMFVAEREHRLHANKCRATTGVERPAVKCSWCGVCFKEPSNRSDILGGKRCQTHFVEKHNWSGSELWKLTLEDTCEGGRGQFIALYPSPAGLMRWVRRGGNGGGDCLVPVELGFDSTVAPDKPALERHLFQVRDSWDSNEWVDVSLLAVESYFSEE
jgi:hypothetical protein